MAKKQYSVSVFYNPRGVETFKGLNARYVEDLAYELSKEPDVFEVHLYVKEGCVTNLVGVYEDGIETL